MDVAISRCQRYHIDQSDTALDDLVGDKPERESNAWVRYRLTRVMCFSA